jgi:hypothetical protein
MEEQAVNDELVAYLKRLQQRSGQRWAITDLYDSGSYYRAIIVSETGPEAKRYLWYDWNRWRWDGHNAGWAGYRARKAALQEVAS